MDRGDSTSRLQNSQGVSKQTLRIFAMEDVEQEDQPNAAIGLADPMPSNVLDHISIP